MNRAATQLKTESQAAVLGLLQTVELTLMYSDAPPRERANAVELGHAVFAQLNALLKIDLDTNDITSFAEIDTEWAQAFRHLGLVDIEHDDDMPTIDVDSPSAPIRTLLRYRDVLWLGLVMWSAHIAARLPIDRADDGPISALRVLSRHFTNAEHVLDTLDFASEQEAHDGVPWSSWFLSELPAREAHFVPTRHELLFAAMLMCVLIIGDQQAQPLRPRDWYTWRYDELTGALERLDADAERWSRLLVLPTVDSGYELPDSGTSDRWRAHVGLLSEALSDAKRVTETTEAERLRSAPLDEERIASFRRETLSKLKSARLLRDVFAHQQASRTLKRKPPGTVGQEVRNWMPKSFFTFDSRLVGLDMVSGDIARLVARLELQQLVRALPAKDPATNEDAFADTVVAVVEDMRRHGRSVSLMLMPVRASFQLHAALGIDAPDGSGEWQELMPTGRQHDFRGVFAGVPILEVPDLSPDQLWVLDLAATAEYVEWPSDDDSGVRYSLTGFDADQARSFLAEHPEVRRSDQTFEEAVDDLQDRVFLTMRLCWEIRPVSSDAAVPIKIPPELRLA